MSSDAFNGLAEYVNVLDTIETIDLEKQKYSSDIEFNKWIGKFLSDDAGVKNDKYVWSDLQNIYPSWNEINLPGLWENSGIKELKDLDGVVWFEKSFNVGKSDNSKKF
ncbi:MAG: hypothetical protein R2771_10450 [Saprospiraceae bacterium]